MIHPCVVCAVPSGPPRNLMPANVTSRSITLTWDPPYPNEWNGIILYYVVDIVEMESGEHRQEVSTNSTSLLVYQLHPYYSYSFNVSAATTIGPGPQSEVFTVRALEEGEATWCLLHKHATTSFYSICPSSTCVTSQEFQWARCELHTYLALMGTSIRSKPEWFDSLLPHLHH